MPASVYGACDCSVCYVRYEASPERLAAPGTAGQGSHFPAVSRISAKMKFQNPRKKNKPLIREKKSGPIYL